MDDIDWSVLFMELSKDAASYRELYLTLDEKFDRNHLKHLETLFDKQCQIKSLTIFDYLLDTSIQLELFRYLKQNNSITEFTLFFKIESDVFSELIDILMHKNNIVRLDLYDCSNIGDEEAVMLTEGFKTNTVLQTLSLERSKISDIGFKALITSLPKSLFQLKLQDNLITAKSLHALLAFVKDHSNLEIISIKNNGISNYCSSQINEH